MTGEQQSVEKLSVFRRPVVHLLAIAGLVFLIYSNTFDVPFEFDDVPNLVNNPAIKDFHYYSDPSMVKHIDKSITLNRPIFKTRYIGYLTFALNYSLHGLDVRGYHLVNILIHAFNALLLYWFMTLTFRTPFFSGAGRQLTSPEGTRNFIAVFTALFFAVHPIQTQAVTYIVQRFTSLATLFYLLALVMYIKWRKSKEQQAGFTPSVMLYAISLLCALLAMKTKEFAFTLPVIMVIYELMLYEGKVMKRLLYLAPFFLAVLLIPLALAGTGDSPGAVSGISDEAAQVSGASGSISRGDYLFTQFRVIVTYIRLLFFPVNQNIDYDYPVFSSFFSPSVFLSFLFLLSVITAGIYLYRLSKSPERKDRFWLRLISFGIFWFFITLSAESGVIPIKDVIFEHRVYLPSVGFFIAFTAVVRAGMERWGDKVAYTKKTVVYIMLAVMFALSGATYARNAIWADSISLWGNAVEGSPNKARPHYNLGFAFTGQHRIDEAIREYKTALKLDPDYVEAHYNLGSTYMGQEMIDEAISEFQAVLKINPDYPMAGQFLEYALQRKKAR